MNRIILLTFTAGVLLALTASCGKHDKQQSETPATENRMVLTEADTTTTLGMTREFMDRVMARQFDEAAAMLYTVDFNDPDQEPYPITAEMREEMQQMFQIPIKRYEIVDYIFDTPGNNEIQCKIYITDNAATNWYFKPVRYLGDWYLCMKDSSEGDRPMRTKTFTPAE